MPKLFMTLVGCSLPVRHTEQHDVFFGIGETINDIIPDVKAFWPGAGMLHFDAWREVNYVNGFTVRVVEKPQVAGSTRLFFVNLGGYKKQEFEEFHYKMIIAAPDKGAAIKISKRTAFFRHTGFKTANAHIDDKFGVDVDDLFAIPDILPARLKEQFSIVVEEAATGCPEDEIHLGYFRLEAADKWAF